MRTRPVLLALAAVLYGTALPLLAQDTLSVRLDEIQIEAARQTAGDVTAPFAVAVERRDAATVALDPGLSLETTLRRLPGLWVNDRAHFALGERMSIRGMGWRAAFGVRGVQVVLDDVPLTMPDGQTVIDFVDPAFIRRAELVRGPASLFWGNGSGGTLFLSTAGADAPPLRLRAMGGSHGTRHLSAESGVRAGAHRFQLYASDVRQDGFRTYSAGRYSRAALLGDLAFDRARLRLVFAATGQDAENPGSLTRAQANADPAQPNPRNVATGAGKWTTHAQTGATLTVPSRLGVLTASAYGLRRDLDNALAVTYIRLDRSAGGLRLAFQQESGPLQWAAGADAGLLDDDRRNWDNVDGGPGDTLRLDQRETVRALAAFGHARVALGRRLSVSAGLRLDHLRFGLDDHLVGGAGATSGDESGSRTFAAWSPALAVSYRLRAATLFASLSTAFESPTTTELVNRPDLTGGFNPDLDPQRVVGLEAGARGTLAGARLSYDLAVFRMRVYDRLTPFEIGEGGRTFYRNSGENLHAGVELALEWQAAEPVRLLLTYTGSRFTYRDAPLTGNRLPGVPDHHVVGGVEITRRGLRLRLDAEAAGRFFVDDANTERNDGYVVVDAGLGHTGLRVGAARLQPFAAVRNVFDVQYTSSVIVNAAAGRYYEPAPGRTIQAGLGVTF